MGSTHVARRAGNQVASNAMRPNNSGTQANDTASIELSPNKVGKQTRHDCRARNARQNPSSDRLEALAYHQTQHLDVLRAKRHADADLSRSLRHAIADHAVDAHARKQQSESPNNTRENSTDARHDEIRIHGYHRV